MTKQKWIEVLSLVDDKYILEADPLNKAKFNLSWHKIVIIAASICVFVIAIVLSFLPFIGAVHSTGFEWGFKYENAESSMPSYCAYKYDKNEFDIDDVTITFYFGRDMSSIEWERKIWSIPEFDVFFGDINYEPIHIIRHSTENYVSEEYRCKKVRITEPQGCRGSKEFTVIEYNHSEEVTIPKELFNKEQGVLHFRVGGIGYFTRDNSEEYVPLNAVEINYDIVNGKVVLSKWDGRRE